MGKRTKDLPQICLVMPQCGYQDCGSLDINPTENGTRKYDDGGKMTYGVCKTCGRVTKLCWFVRDSD